MTYDEIILQVAKDTGLNKNLVNKIYRTYWKTIREHISTLPLMEDLADEEFLKLRPNVNIPSIGKMYVTLERYKNIRKADKMIKEKYLNK